MASQWEVGGASRGGAQWALPAAGGRRAPWGALGGGRGGRYGDTLKQNPKGRNGELWTPPWADGLSRDAGLRWVVEHVAQN